jgi:hypothetical protein
MKVDMMEQTEIDLGRRKFLSAAKYMGAMSAAVLLMGRSTEIQAEKVTDTSIDPPAGSGYHETEHIRKYYYSARYF